MNEESISFVVDTRSVTQAITEMNNAMAGMEGKGTSANQKLNESFQKVSDLLIKLNDRSRTSMESLTKSIMARNDAEGKSGVDRLIAQRDQYIKRLGSEKDLIEQVTKSYEKLIKAQGGGGGNGFKEFGENIAKFIESPLQAAQGAASGLLEKLGPMGAVVAGTATAIAAFAAASFEAAKSVGEWGVRLNDIQLRTGLSAKQLGEFDYAAKAVGADLSIFERTMRGLTTALEDTSNKGEQARKWLVSWGVDIAAVRAGSADTADTLQKVGEGLAGLPAGFERNKAAIDIFKKAGLDLIPVLTELNEHVLEAKEEGFGFKQQDIENAKAMEAELAKVEKHISGLIRADIKVPLANAFIAVSEAAENLNKKFENSFLGKLLSLAGGISKATLSGTPNPAEIEMRESEGFGYGATSSSRMHRAEANGISRENAVVDAALERWGRSKEGLEAALTKAKQNETEALDKLRNHDKSQMSGGRDAASELKKAQADITKYDDQLKAMEKADALQRSLPDLMRQARGFDTSPGRKYSDQFRNLHGSDAGQAAYDVGFGNQLEKIAKELEVKRLKVVDELVKDTIEQQVRIESANASILQSLIKAQKLDGLDAMSALGGLAVGGPPGPSSKDFNARIQGGMSAQLRAAQQSKGSSPLEIAQMEFGIRKQAADYELSEALERSKISKDSVAAEYDARYEHQTKLNAAQSDFELSMQGVREKQFEAIKQTAEGLAHTLFTNPKGFSKQLQTTLRDQALKPIENLIGNAVGHALVDGTSPDKALFVHVVGMGKPGVSNGGGGGGGSYGGGGFGGFSGGDFGGFIGGGLGPGGTAGFAPGSLGIGGSGSGGGGLGGLLGGFSKSGLSLKGLGSIFSRDKGGTPGINGQPGTDDSPRPDGGFGAGLAGVGASAALGLGSNLAMSGLTGKRRGTWGGIGEDTAGGALAGAGIGFMVGGPLGAAIGAGVGAAAGFVAGGLEKLFGAESPENEAKRLVKQDYHVSITDSIASQIANIATSKYGGTISVAVRSPEVRQMLGLYAASTGQNMPQSALAPHAGGLSEHSGSLYQDASYQYGKAYSFASNLPVSGGMGTSQLPGFGGNPTLAINVNGTAVTPDFVQAQFSNSQQASIGRLSNSAVIQDPGLIIS